MPPEECLNLPSIALRVLGDGHCGRHGGLRLREGAEVRGGRGAAGDDGRDGEQRLGEDADQARVRGGQGLLASEAQGSQEVKAKFKAEAFSMDSLDPAPINKWVSRSMSLSHGAEL